MAAATRHDALEPFQRQLLEYFQRTGTSRVQQQFIEALFQPRLPGQILRQIGGMKLHITQPIVLRIRPRPRHQAGIAFTPTTVPSPATRASGR